MCLCYNMRDILSQNTVIEVSFRYNRCPRQSSNKENVYFDSNLVGFVHEQNGCLVWACAGSMSWQELRGSKTDDLSGVKRKISRAGDFGSFSRAIPLKA